MTRDQIVAMQRRIGVEADGWWGPQSIAACQSWLRRLMPLPNPWPKQHESALVDFYGPAGDESKLVSLSVAGMGLQYDGHEVRTVRCHRRVAASLGRVLTALGGIAPGILTQYDGCYANRSMRGAARPSLHARGAAIDFASSSNGNATHWPARATMPLEVMEAFAREGWLAAGAFWGRDAMHFQATV